MLVTARADVTRHLLSGRPLERAKYSPPVAAIVSSLFKGTTKDQATSLVGTTSTTLSRYRQRVRVGLGNTGGAD